MSKFHCIWCNKELEQSDPKAPHLRLAIFDKNYIFCNHCAKNLLLEYLYKIGHPITQAFKGGKQTITLVAKQRAKDEKVFCDLCKMFTHQEITSEFYYVLTVGEEKLNICLEFCLNTILLNAILPEDSTFVPSFSSELEDKYSFLLEEPEEEKQVKEDKKDDEKLITPREIKKIMDQYVIGQDKAKKILAVAVYEHYKQAKYKETHTEDLLTTKKNILILGPTGCGKTHLTRVLANILKVPFYTAIAYNYTKEGYVGLSVNEMLKDLYLISGNDLEKTERGIIYIDEVDKIAKSNGTGPDVNGASVQQALLSLVEGAKVPVEIAQGKKILIDTKNILFIAGGAFTDIIPIIEKRLGKRKQNTIGFSGPKEETVEEEIEKANNIYELIKPQDLFKYGMLEEFIGRFPTFAPISNLSQKELVRILVEPKNSIIKNYVDTFKVDGIELIFTEDALNEIAKSSLERKTGARGLDGIVDPIIKDLEFEVAGDDDVISCTITDEVIRGEKPPVVKRKSDE